MKINKKISDLPLATSYDETTYVAVATGSPIVVNRKIALVDIVESGSTILSTSLSTEISDRISGDSSLTYSLSTEISDRISGISSLSTSIDIILSSGYDDTVIVQRISNEESNRISADSSLTSNISTEISNRISGDESLSSGLSIEVSSRISGDSSLTSVISTEVSDRISIDSSLSTSLSTETSNRTSGDSSLSTSLSTETSNRTSGDSSLSTSLLSETSSRISGDGSLSTIISSEVSSRTSGDASIISLLSSDYVPYSGANKDVNLGTNDLSTAGIKLNTTTPLVVSNPGEIGWNADWGTIDIRVLNGSTLQVGQEMYIYGKCINGETIPNGAVVQFAGVQGNHILIKRAVQSEITINPLLILGVATDNITSNNYGYITTFGVVNNIYTYNWSLSQQLWFDISGTTPGAITNIEPTVPNRKIRIGNVIMLQTGQSESGIININLNFGIKLGDLDDVNGTLPVEGSILEYKTGGYFDFTKNINDYALVSSLSTEISSRTSGDASLSTAISSIGSLGYNDISITTALSSEISSRTSGDASLTTKLSNYLPLSTINDTKDITGFIKNSDITVTYNYTNRTITLNGSDLSYMYRGVKYTLGNGLTWTSTEHTNTVGNWFLYSINGSDFIWSQNMWNFEDIMVSYVNYQSTSANTFAIKDCHSTMDWRTHQELHNQIGTYLKSGGKLTVGTYNENTNTDVATTPGFDAAVVKDEDCETSIGIWSEGSYTLMYVNNTTSTSTFVLNNSFPFLTTAGTTININNITTGALSNGSANRWYNIYQILLPTSIDTDSAKYRMIMLQPQAVFTSLASAQAEDVRTLSLGGLTGLSPEFVIYARITYVTSGANNTGKCAIATNGISYVLGNKNAQVNVAGIAGTNHTALANLTWDISGHIGTANTIPAFDNSGLATEIVTSSLATSSALSTEISTRTSADSSLTSVIGDINTILSNIIG